MEPTCPICEGFEATTIELHARQNDVVSAGYYAVGISILKLISFIENEATKHRLRDSHEENLERVYFG